MDGTDVLWVVVTAQTCILLNLVGEYWLLRRRYRALHADFLEFMGRVDVVAGRVYYVDAPPTDSGLH